MLPVLGLRWSRFRQVRGQVCKRIHRRMSEVGAATAEAYRARLEGDPAEWAVLDGLCRVTISRFFRDRLVWERLRTDVLPAAAGLAARMGTGLRCWSAGCASGEEPYGVAILFHLEVAPAFPSLGLSVVATDVDEVVLERARRACFPPGALRRLPEWAAAAFEPRSGALCVRSAFRADVELHRQDLRREMPDGPFQLVLCRNLAFTYFDDATQRRVLDQIRARVAPGGFLIVGIHEELPEAAAFTRLAPRLPIYAATAVGERASPATPPDPRGRTPS